MSPGIYLALRWDAWDGWFGGSDLLVAKRFGLNHSPFRSTGQSWVGADAPIANMGAIFDGSALEPVSET